MSVVNALFIKLIAESYKDGKNIQPKHIPEVHPTSKLEITGKADHTEQPITFWRMIQYSR